MSNLFDEYDSPVSPERSRGNLFDQFDQSSPTEAPAERNQGLLGDTTDLLQKGLWEAASGIGQFAESWTPDLGLGITAAADLRDWAKGHADKQLETLSPETLESYNKQIISDKDGEIWGEGATDFRSWLAHTTEMIGLMGLPIPAGAALTGVVRAGMGITKAAKALQVADKTGKLSFSAAKQLALKNNKVKDWISTTIGYGGAEAMVGAGASGSGARQQVLSTPFDELTESQTYQAHLQSTGSPEAAREALANDVGDATVYGATLPTMVLGAGAGRIYDDMLKGFGKSRLANIKRGLLTEAAEEAPQSAAEQISANYANREYIDPEQPLLEGTGKAALEGGLFGAILGGGMAAPIPVGRIEPTDPIKDIGNASSVDEVLDAAARATEPMPLTGTVSPAEQGLLSQGTDLGQAQFHMEPIDQPPLTQAQINEREIQRIMAGEQAPPTPLTFEEQNQADMDRNDILRAKAYEAAGIAPPEPEGVPVERNWLHQGVAGQPTGFLSPEGDREAGPLIRSTPKSRRRNLFDVVEAEQQTQKTLEEEVSRTQQTPASNAMAQAFAEARKPPPSEPPGGTPVVSRLKKRIQERDEAKQPQVIDEATETTAPEATEETSQAARAAEIDAAANQAASSPTNNKSKPTKPQIEAGNYELGHPVVQGLQISIESAKGSIRSGTDESGKKWSQKMVNHYGYILGTEAMDGTDKMDVFLGEAPADASRNVYVIDQVDPVTGKPDEHKVILGEASESGAKKTYLANFEKGWKGFGAIKALSMDQFKDWLKSGKTKKPIALKPASPKEVPRETPQRSLSDIRKEFTTSKKDPQKLEALSDELQQRTKGAEQTAPDTRGANALRKRIQVEIKKATKEAEQVKEQPKKSRPLDKIQIHQRATVEGENITVVRKADQAIQAADDRISALEQLKRCLAA